MKATSQQAALNAMNGVATEPQVGPALWTALKDARTEERDAETQLAEIAESHKAAKERLAVASAKVSAIIDEARSPGLFTPAEGEA
jgi:hypothetical protein